MFNFLVIFFFTFSTSNLILSYLLFILSYVSLSSIFFYLYHLLIQIFYLFYLIFFIFKYLSYLLSIISLSLAFKLNLHQSKLQIKFMWIRHSDFWILYYLSQNWVYIPNLAKGLTICFLLFLTSIQQNKLKTPKVSHPIESTKHININKMPLYACTLINLELHPLGILNTCIHAVTSNWL